MIPIIINILWISLCLHGANSAKILGIFPAPSFSHQQTFQPIWKELSLRGHNVTVITTNPLGNNSLINLTEINVGFTYEHLLNSSFIQHLYEPDSVFRKVYDIHRLGLEINEAQIMHEKIQHILNENETKFDLILIQVVQSFTDLTFGYAAKYKCPVVGISSLGVFFHFHDFLGNPTHPVVSPDMMLGFAGKINFFQKLQSLLYNLWYRLFYYWYILPNADRVARKHFGDDMPYLGDIERNMSLLLVNSNPVIHAVRPNVPNIVEICRLHISEKKPLPKDIKDYLDSSTQGVVYFSLGSNVKSTYLSVEVRQEIIKALGELPYNVLWKWETDHLPDRPPNVLTRKWLPQQDILGHPNIKAFVTQGGLQSIEEAITNEVPLVGIPFITDQPSNIKRIVELGMGQMVEQQTLTKEKLKKAILEVAGDPEYKENVSKAKSIMDDQPMKGVDKAVWWIEYVIRHNGAKHLRSQAADMSFFEYFMIDVALFLFACIFAMYYLVAKIVSAAKQCTNSNNKVKRN
ncbi:unnamed protein product [Phyllotreta striolata]|uniref:UDP-glucuronosyltransferase n=1 Tax=Phyllotreta striolata TaxID=444603 RepID=A0A9N9TFF8_PHYSR|nr:unnamed protein product [Phyllotreta striolata]